MSPPAPPAVPSVIEPQTAVAEDDVSQQLQQQLSDAIFEHRIPPGTKLPELDLCRIFGVTRGVIRKVLAQLAGEQLVDLFPNRGAFVARPSVELTRDVFTLRRILESGVVRCLAHGTQSRSWLDAVRRQVGEEREANRTGDTGRYIRLAGKFHLDLAAETGNAALEQHLRRVVSQTSLMVALYESPGSNTCSALEHLEILEAIAAREFARAEQLMEEHLQACERQLRLDDEAAPAVNLADALRPPAQHTAAGRVPATTARTAAHPRAAALHARATARPHGVGR